MVTETKPRRKSDRTFKQEAAHNWLHSGKAASVVADELAITANCLYNWKKAFAPNADLVPNTPELSLVPPPLFCSKSPAA